MCLGAGQRGGGQWGSGGAVRKCAQASSHKVIKSVCLPLERTGTFLSSTALISQGAAGTVDIRGKMISLGPGEMARRWGGSDGLPPGGGLVAGRKSSTSQFLLMHSSVIALPVCKCVRYRGTGVINGQQRQSWDVWPTLCGLFSILGEESGK